MQRRGGEHQVFVAGFPPDETSDDQLRGWFVDHFGPDLVVSTQIIRDRESGRSKGYGFVAFSTAEGAARGIAEMAGKDVAPNWKLRVSQTQKNAAAAGGGGGGYSGGGGGYPGGASQGYGQQQMQGGWGAPAAWGAWGAAYGAPAGYGMMPNAAAAPASLPYAPAPAPEEGPTNLFVGGLDMGGSAGGLGGAGVSEAELFAAFVNAGPVSSIKVPPGKGCAFVTYQHRATAARAIETLQGYVLAGKYRLRLEWGRAPPSGGSSSGGGAAAPPPPAASSAPLSAYAYSASAAVSSAAGPGGMMWPGSYGAAAPYGHMLPHAAAGAAASAGAGGGGGLPAPLYAMQHAPAAPTASRDAAAAAAAAAALAHFQSLPPAHRPVHVAGFGAAPLYAQPPGVAADAGEAAPLQALRAPWWVMLQAVAAADTGDATGGPAAAVAAAAEAAARNSLWAAGRAALAAAQLAAEVPMLLPESVYAPPHVGSALLRTSKAAAAPTAGASAASASAAAAAAAAGT